MTKEFPDGSTVIGRTVDKCIESNAEVHLISDSENILNKTSLSKSQKHIEKKGSSGTERISFFLNDNDNFNNSDLGIIILGDQPEIDPNLINFICDEFDNLDKYFDGLTLHLKSNNQENFTGVNNCKMVLGKNNQIYYISRSPIPGYKDGNLNPLNSSDHFQHVSIVALKIKWIKRYAELDYFNCQRENNEWLPFILNGCKIKSIEMDFGKFEHLRDVNDENDWNFYEKRYNKTS